MKKPFLLLAACNWLFAAASFAQAPAIEWQNTIGGSDEDALYSIQQTTDGGYVLGGSSKSNISGDKTENSYGDWDYWVIKLDSIGNILWQNTIRGDEIDHLNDVTQTTDGGFILGGTSSSDFGFDKTENSLGNQDYWVVRLDPSGNIIWQNTIGGSASDQLNSVQETSDGGYILGGYSYSPASGDKTEGNWDPTLISADYWIIKLDASGSIQWQNTIGGNYGDELSAIQQTIDGGYILGGNSNSPISGDKTEDSLSADFWIIKLDTQGNIIWQNTIGGDDIDVCSSIQQTSDGGYIFGGSSQSNISGDKTENSLGWRDYWIIKTDTVGNIEWQNTIGGNDMDFLSSVKQTSDGGYILGGRSTSNISGDKAENVIGGMGYYDYWVIKLDSTGNIIWQNTIGGNYPDELSEVQETFDGGYILGGTSGSDISGDKTENCIGGFSDYWVIKLFPDTITGISNVQPQTSNFKLFPNPAQEEFTVSGLPFPVQKIEIINLLGETVLTHQSEIRSRKIGTKSEIKINILHLPTGIYIIKVYADEGVFQQKLVKK